MHRHIRSDTSCLLRDLSPGGARLIVSGTVPLPGHFELVVDVHETTRPVELIWRQGDETGVRFAPRFAKDCGLQDDRAEVGGLQARLEAAFDRRLP